MYLHVLINDANTPQYDLLTTKLCVTYSINNILKKKKSCWFTEIVG